MFGLENYLGLGWKNISKFGLEKQVSLGDESIKACARNLTRFSLEYELCVR